ncbi:MAG: hypothetical protein ACRECX_02680 [Methyloceanibacter sp.]|uniref:hypothetical protein n=1 Tax=Methyloceanibacter sp. TaxID=1965321 RepID=UPI003D6D4FBC
MAATNTWVGATSDYNLLTNWSPPDGPPTVTAIFVDIDELLFATSLTFSSASTSVGAWTFNADADEYDFTIASSQAFTFQGTGITNASANDQDIFVDGNGTLTFNGASTAANNTGTGGTII